MARGRRRLVKEDNFASTEWKRCARTHRTSSKFDGSSPRPGRSFRLSGWSGVRRRQLPNIARRNRRAHVRLHPRAAGDTGHGGTRAPVHQRQTPYSVAAL